MVGSGVVVEKLVAVDAEDHYMYCPSPASYLPPFDDREIHSLLWH